MNYCIYPRPLPRSAKIEDIENFIHELRLMYVKLQDDYISDECRGLLKDICSQKNICYTCFEHIEEGYDGDGNYYKTCNCPNLPEWAR